MEALDEMTEKRFLTGVRPDGPVFAIGREAEPNRGFHVVEVREVSGRDEGVFIARCYSCERFECFNSYEGLRYFNPFTGDALAPGFADVFRVGAEIREEWMARRKALRAATRASAKARRPSGRSG